METTESTASVRAITNRLRAYQRATADLPDAIRTAKDAGWPVGRIAREAGIARTTVYRALKDGRVVITTPSKAAALALADTLNEVGGVLHANGRQVEVDNDDITMSQTTFALLSSEDEDHDGHFDGENIWFSGDPYPVTVPS